MQYNDAKEYVNDVLLSLQDDLLEWEPLQTRADVRAYSLLAAIFEKAAEIDKDDVKRRALVDSINSIKEVVHSKKWSAAGKSSTELIVTYLLGLRKHRSRKHNWISTLEYAKESNVEPTVDGFLAWIQSPKIGGIDGAAELYRGEAEPLAPAELSQIAAQLENEAGEAPTVDLKLGASAPAGLAILLVRRTDDQHAMILRQFIEESQIRRVLADLRIIPKAKKRHSETQIRNAERQSLYVLNRITSKLADGRSLGKKNDAPFAGAVRRLKSIPQLRDRFFEGPAKIHIIRADHNGKGGEIEVKNSDFDVLDPGRFISGARRGTLIPYAFDEADPSNNRKALFEYLDSQKQRKPVKPEPRTDAPTLDKFLEHEAKRTGDLGPQEE